MYHYKKYFSVYIILWILTSITQTVYAQDEQELNLTTGGSTIIRTESPINRVVVGNPRVADVRETSDKELLVVGVGSGRTNITIITGRRTLQYSVQVTAVETGSLLAMIRSFIGRIEGIYTRIFGETIVIEGDATSAEDYGRAQRAVELFGNQVKNLVRFRPSAVEEINELFNKAGLGEVHASLVGGKVFLEGSVGSDEDLKKVNSVASAYGLSVENLVTKGRAKMVEIDVEFVELRRSGHDLIGIQWPTNISAGADARGTIVLLPTGGSNSLSLNLTGSTEMGINLLLTSGYGRLLAQPRLVCASGSQATFLAGGEVPVVIVTNNVVNVDYRSFGIKLNIAPISDTSGTVSMELEAEVSQVDESLRVMDIPGFRTRRITTTVVVRDGQTIVLGGLFSNDEVKSVSKFPLLGQIPILGELFRSREFREERSNLVIFVTPHIVTADSPRIQRTIRNIQRMYQEAEDEVGWELLETDSGF